MAHHTTILAIALVIYASCHASVIPTTQALEGVCTFPDRAQTNPFVSSTATQQCPDNQRPPDGVSITPDVSSTCPWRYNINHDPNRIPAYIGEASCSCDYCLNPLTSEPEYDLTCEPVTYPMKVLVRKESSSDDGSSHEYEVVNYDVAVSCACIRLP